MKLGFGAPVSGSWATPDVITQLCREAEDLGYASLWTFQRLLYPAETQIGPTYQSVLDPLSVLAFLASATQRARLAVAVVNFPFTPPLPMAKQLAAIDVLSGGRLTVGLGLGWAPEEFTAAEASSEHRPARAGEYVQALEAIFSGHVDFDGEFYRVPAGDTLPQPVQRPRPPILFGGNVPAALKRAGRISDGWISSSRADLTRIADSIALVREGAAEAGRDPGAVQIVIRGVVELGAAAAGSDRRPLTGSAEQIAGDLARLEEQGVTEVFLDLNFDPAVGSVAADVSASVARAQEALHAFAPLLNGQGAG